jgi:hypothetical protein
MTLKSLQRIFVHIWKKERESEEAAQGEAS